MPASKRPAGPMPVEAITHADKRANLPTSDASDFVDPEIDQPIPVRYPRDPTLDPQLVWRGKDDLDGEDLVADAPAIYIQEKIDPRAIVENLRDTAARREDEPELTLFDTFDGLGELDLVDFYRHQANWSNRMILGDSLNVMASLAEREALRGKVQMIYIDPPYGIKFGSNWQVSARKRDVKDGKLEDASREVEQIKAFRDAWELGIHSYLTYLRDRLTVARDLLTESGSIFVQIGDENVHLVRSLMDEVFGSENFAGQVVFNKTSSQSTTKVQSVFDVLLVYAKSSGLMKFRQLSGPKEAGERGARQYTLVFSPDLSQYRRMSPDELRGLVNPPPGWRVGRLGWGPSCRRVLKEGRGASRTCGTESQYLSLRTPTGSTTRFPVEQWTGFEDSGGFVDREGASRQSSWRRTIRRHRWTTSGWTLVQDRSRTRRSTSFRRPTRSFSGAC